MAAAEDEVFLDGSKKANDEKDTHEWDEEA